MKRNLKHFMSITMVFIFAIVITGCGDSEVSSGDSTKPDTITCELQRTDNFKSVYIQRFENDKLVEKKVIDIKSFDTKEAAQEKYDGMYIDYKEISVVEGTDVITTTIYELTAEDIEFAGTFDETYERMTDPKYNYTCKKS